MNQIDKDRCGKINHTQALDKLAFEAAWNAFQNTKTDLAADYDDETCRGLHNAIRAYFTANT